jgi:hypothetical protein
MARLGKNVQQFVRTPSGQKWAFLRRGLLLAFGVISGEDVVALRESEEGVFR